MCNLMKIAIPFFIDRISNRLDCSENFLFVTVKNNVVLEQKKIRLLHTQPSTLVDILLRLKVDILICNGITESYSKEFKNTHIRVIPWVGGNVDAILNQYMATIQTTNNMDTAKPAWMDPNFMSTSQQ